MTGRDIGNILCTDGDYDWTYLRLDIHGERSMVVVEIEGGRRERPCKMQKRAGIYGSHDGWLGDGVVMGCRDGSWFVRRENWRG